MNSNVRIEDDDQGDPVARPHYPLRLLQAAKLTFTIVEEEHENSTLEGRFASK